MFSIGFEKLTQIFGIPATLLQMGTSAGDLVKVTSLEDKSHLSPVSHYRKNRENNKQ
jgi:hypothetical protein